MQALLKHSHAITEQVIDSIMLDPALIANIRRLKLHQADNATEWKAFIVVADKWEARFITVLKELFRAQEAEMMTLIPALSMLLVAASLDYGYTRKDAIDDAFDSLTWEQKTASVGAPIIQGSLLDNANRVYGTLGVQGSFDVINPRVTEFIGNKTFKFAKQITETTQNQLRAALRAGISEGEGIGELANRVQGVFGHADKARAKMIARTEVLSATNFGTQEAYIQSGVVWGSRWIPTLDDRVRDSHAVMLNQVRKTGVRFLTGARNKLMRPGDPNGKVAEIVNCFPGDTAIAMSPGIEKIYRRHYEGDLIEITISSGMKLTGTPNHPILTDKGWIPLDFLVKGDNVICAGFSEKTSFCNPDKQHKPIMLDEIFSFGNVVAANHRIAGANMDFHGDGMTGDVNVISFNGKLGNILNASIGNPARENRFSHANIAEGILFSDSSFTKLGDRPLNSPDSIMGGSGQTHSIGRGSLGHTEIHSLATIPNMNTGFNEPPPNNRPIRIERFCNSFLGFSRGVTTDNITNVKIKPHSGHVYNLQTKDGWYAAINNNITQLQCNGKGIITHNCRCTLSAVFEKPA